MNSFKINISLFLLLFPLFVFTREKIALAVLDFEGKQVDQIKTEAVTDLLRTELFNTGSFKVIERQRIVQIIEEQKFQASGMTDTDRAVEIGRLLNVEKIMIGTVTKLGYTYIINTRIVDVQSGAVILAEAIERRGGEDELPGAIAELATTISFKVGLEGSIIRMGSNEIFVDLGKADGVKLGQTFSVIRPGEVITDLEGRIIGTTQEIIGQVVVSKTQDRFSVTSVVEQLQEFRKGDIVRPAKPEDSLAAPKPKVKTETVKTKPKPVIIKQPKKKESQSTDVPPIF